MKKIKVFISSAQDELEYEREVAKSVVLGMDLECSIFEDFLAMNKYVEDSYLDEIEACDIFVIILWRSLRPAVKREYEQAVSTGRPILMFSKLLKENEEREPDLKQFLDGNLDPASQDKRSPIYFRKSYRSLADFATVLREGIIGEISRRISREPVVTHTHEEMYELGTKIVKSARKRLFVAQRTPSLFFGPMGYENTAETPLVYETKFYEAISDWCRIVETNDNTEFILLYDVEATKNAIEKHNMHAKVKDAIISLKDLQTKTGGNFRLSPSPPKYSGPIGVGDDWFAFWILGTHDSICISYANEKIADEFAQIFRQISSKSSSDVTLLEELGISQ